MSQVSLKSIASELGISIATVCWVLSGKGKEKGIASSTQKKILAYAKEKNYRPNLLARALNKGNSQIIGLIVPSISDMFYASIAKEIEGTLEKLGYSLIICSSESEQKREDKMIDVLISHQVDGIIIAPTKVSDTKIRQLIEEKIPFVLFDRFFIGVDTNYVIINNEECSYELVRHLIKKGSRKIAIITVNPHLLTMNMRFEGYARALKAYDLPLNSDLYGLVDFIDYEAKVDNVLDCIIEKVHDVDGFFFTTHILAIEAFRYFNKHNLDFNKLFRLASIHEDPLFPILAPNINVAKMPIKTIGTNVVHMMLNTIKNKDKYMHSKSLILQCDLIFRD